jgi:site-specific DNA-methyltransferase (adenine-specific)
MSEDFASLLTAEVTPTTTPDSNPTVTEIVDTPVDDGIDSQVADSTETPAETNESDESDGEKPTEKDEKVDGRTNPAKIRSALKAFREASPENAQAAKALNDSYGRWEAAKQVFPGGVSEMKTVKAHIYNSELTEWSSTYSDSKFHAVISDPPYGLEFANKSWDSCSTNQFTSWGTALLPHLHPGAIVLMFGGTRTWHKLATGMEEAGFELWDTLMWLHGMGFPKGQDISRLIDAELGLEREVVGRRSDSGLAQAGVYDAGFKADYNLTAPSPESSSWAGHKTPSLKPVWEPILCFRAPRNSNYAQLALEHGSGTINVAESRIGTEGGHITVIPAPKGSPTVNAYGKGINGRKSAAVENMGRYPANLILDEVTAPMLDESARFFYCAKASPAERNSGLTDLKNTHPCVKPLSLIGYIAKLILPPASVPNRRILVPFSGSGSEMIGCLAAGWDEIVGVEMDAHFCEIARQRLEFHAAENNQTTEPLL